MKAITYQLLRPVAAALLGGILAVGCSNKASTTETSSTATESTSTSTASTPEKLSGKPFLVGYNQWIGSVGVFLAKEKGYFKDAGLNVEMKQFAGPADSVPPLITGQLDAALTTADTPILLSKEANSNPVKNVFITDTSAGADAVVAQAGINSLKDLKGKTVAATKGQCNELLLMKGLRSAGLTDKDVTITNMDADAAGAAVVAKKVSAAVTWEPWITKASTNGAKVIYSTKDAPNLILDVVAVSQTTMDDKPADVRAFVAACVKGNEYAIKNPNEAAKVAAKYFGSTEKEALDMMTKVKLYTGADNARLMGTKTAPGPVAQSTKEIADFFVSQKVLTAAPTEATFFNATYLPTQS
jgi:NitT/TauT family transport system substrate-binding protein